MKQRGFTVIELMVVVVVVAIMATLAGPSFVEMLDRRRLVNQTEAIAELLQLAKLEALKHSSTGTVANRGVAFTIKPVAPWHAGLKAGSAACDAAVVGDCSVNDGGAAVARLVTAVDCTGCTITSPVAQETLVFNFRGLVAGATDVPIRVRSPRGKELQINVSRIGRVAVCSVGGGLGGYPTC